MMCAKTKKQIMDGLSERGIIFSENDTKKELQEKLWANRDKKNFAYVVRKLPCGH